jgi:CheY-like chemotaxis protein
VASRRILVVDDDPDTLDVFAAILEAEGFEVATATDGNAALAHLRSGAPPDVLVVDVMMPGMDGVELGRRVAADPRLRATPIVIVSADPDARERARELGAGHQLAKPVDPAVLVRVVNAALASPGAPR